MRLSLWQPRALSRAGVVAGFCAGIATATASNRPLQAQRIDRSVRPVAPKAARFAFPATHEQTLENGLRVVVVEDHALPLVVVRVVLGVDSLDDPPGEEGLFALDTAMLREGTTFESAEEQAAAMASLGNVVSPLRFTTITRNFDASLALMSDMLLHAAFPETALDRLKTMFSATAAAQRQSVPTAARRVLFEKLFGATHPMARSVAFTMASVGSITRDDIVGHYETLIRPNTSAIVIVGDVRAAAVFASVKKHFAGWQRGPTATRSMPPPPAPAPTTIYLVDRPGLQQSMIFVGTLGPDRTSLDFAPLEVMGPVLGATPASRIQQNLRERHAYIYSATTAAVVWRRAPIPAMIYGSAAMAAPKTDSALVEWIGELRGMSTRAPTDEEMVLARGALVGALPAQIETQSGIADRVVSLIQNDLPLDFYDSYVPRIDAVTSREVRDAAARFVDPGHLVIVIAGDAAVLEPVLRARNIAPVVVVGDDGEPRR